MRGAAAFGLLASVVLTATGPAEGAPLLQTDDAGVLAAGECEAEAGITQVRDAGVTVRVRALDAACGIGWHSQLGVGVGWSRAPGAPTERGAALGGKTALWHHRDDDGPALALGWEVAATRPAGRWARAGQAVALLYSVPWAGGELHANLGHERDRIAQASATTWGLAFDAGEHGLGTWAWAPRAEVALDDHGGRGWALGLRLTTESDRFSIEWMYGRPVGPAGPRQSGLGVKLSF